MGERQNVEFKRGISPEDGKVSSVDEEILKSVVAFANTNDGVIFIGIDDFAQVKGLGLDSKAKDRLEGRIRQLVRTRIRPIPPIGIGFEDVRGLVVAKIVVARGESPIYMLGGVVYVRDGSHDVAAQPEQLTRLVLEHAV